MSIPNVNSVSIGIQGGTSRDVAGDTTTCQDNSQREAGDAKLDDTINGSWESSNNGYSPRDYSRHCASSFDSGTINNIGTAQNVNTGANYGQIIQQDSRWAGYADYDEEEDEERECSSSPCQAPMGYFQGPYQSFPAPMNPTSVGHRCGSFDHPQDGPRESIPFATYQRGFYRQAKGATRGNIQRGGYPQPGPHSYHAENHGVDPNEESPEGSLIDSDDEESSAGPARPTDSISPPTPTS